MCTDLVKTCSCAPDLIGIWKCWFLRRAGLGKPGVPREKPLGREPTTNSTHIIMTPGPGIGPRPHWWEANALTTAPSLLPSNIFMVKVEKHFKTACLKRLHSSVFNKHHQTIKLAAEVSETETKFFDTTA